MESPGAYVDDCILRGHFCGVPVLLRTALPRSWNLLHLERGGMPLHVGVGLNCKKGATTEVKAQEPSIWAITDSPYTRQGRLELQSWVP